MQAASVFRVLKFNPNHDPHTGEFTSVPGAHASPPGRDGRVSGHITDRHGKSYTVYHTSKDVGDGQHKHHFRVFESDKFKQEDAQRGITTGEVGFAELHRDGDRVMDVQIDRDHQKKGIGSALYDHIEQTLGHPLKQQWAETDAGKALWASRNRRGQDKSVDASSVPLYRASAHEEVHASQGSYASLGSGAYFATKAEDIAGYGPTVREYRAEGKLLHVRGDKELNPHRDEAQKAYQERVNSIDWTKAKAEDIAFVSKDPLVSHLESKGYHGIYYEQADKTNDHHSQVVVFDPKRVKHVAKKVNPYHAANGEFTSKENDTHGAGHHGLPVAKPLRSRVIPTHENQQHRTHLASYMAGYYNGLKNENEKRYVAERARQMINGELRPSGMSARFGLEKQRAIQYEALTYKIFQAGRQKIGV
jgi:GNAT superfamily N-acetyltransferase